MSIVITAISLAAVMILNPLLVYGASFQSVSEWHSEIKWGILEQEKTYYDMGLKVKTLSKNAVQLIWAAPDTAEKTSSYQILKKTKNANYTEFETTKQTSYVDTDLKNGNYYGYKIIPVFEKWEPDPVTKHGIDRHSNLQDFYKKGQELLAKQITIQKCPKCYDEPFKEINNIKLNNFTWIDKRDSPDFQKRILEEIAKAEKTFSLLILKKQ
jgi:hypothetical protein